MKSLPPAIRYKLYISWNISWTKEIVCEKKFMETWNGAEKYCFNGLPSTINTKHWLNTVRIFPISKNSTSFSLLNFETQQQRGYVYLNFTYIYNLSYKSWSSISSFFSFHPTSCSYHFSPPSFNPPSSRTHLCTRFIIFNTSNLHTAPQQGWLNATFNYVLVLRIGWWILRGFRRVSTRIPSSRGWSA